MNPNLNFYGQAYQNSPDFNYALAQPQPQPQQIYSLYQYNGGPPAQFHAPHTEPQPQLLPPQQHRFQSPLGFWFDGEKGTVEQTEAVGQTQAVVHVAAAQFVSMTQGEQLTYSNQPQIDNSTSTEVIGSSQPNLIEEPSFAQRYQQLDFQQIEGLMPSSSRQIPKAQPQYLYAEQQSMNCFFPGTSAGCGDGAAAGDGTDSNVPMQTHGRSVVDASFPFRASLTNTNTPISRDREVRVKSKYRRHAPKNRKPIACVKKPGFDYCSSESEDRENHRPYTDYNYRHRSKFEGARFQQKRG